jgi:hypothetical protein
MARLPVDFWLDSGEVRADSSWIFSSYAACTESRDAASAVAARGCSMSWLGIPRLFSAACSVGLISTCENEAGYILSLVRLAVVLSKGSP